MGSRAIPLLGTQPSKLVSFVAARRRLYYALAIAALFLTCMFRYWLPFDAKDSVTKHRWEMALIAVNLHEHGQFANPFAPLETGPSAHLSPAFPVFIATVMHFFGEGAGAMFALKVIAVLVVSLQVALLPLFSARLGMGYVTGFIAACVWIVAKPMMQYDWESYYAALLIAVTCCVYRRYLDRGSERPGWEAWLLGCLMGLLMLLIPTVALILATWMGWEIWRRRWAFIKTSLLPLVVLPALIISPWIIRNYLVFHRAMIRDNFGLELAVSNNDCAQFSLRLDIDSECFVHPSVSVTEAKKVLDMGEVQYNDLRSREARQWIASHPSRFFRLTVMRYIAFWFPTESGTIHYVGTGRRQERVLIYLMTLLSIGGQFIHYRRDIKSAAICFSCLLLFPPVYYITQFVFWHEYPILWLTFLLGAFPIAGYLSSKFELLKALD